MYVYINICNFLLYGSMETIHSCNSCFYTGLAEIYLCSLLILFRAVPFKSVRGGGGGRRNGKFFEWGRGRILN